jgi:hypothetical protein
MELRAELYVPLLIGGAAILIFVLRRMSEIKGPRAPASNEISLHQEAPFHDEERVLITHPLIRQAAQRALAAGGESAKFIYRDGDRIYFNFSRIEDPVERKNADELIRGIQEGGHVDMIQVVQLIRRIFNKSSS